MVAVALLHRVDDGARVYALVNVERGMLGLPSPDNLRVQVGVVGIGLFARFLVSFWRDQADRLVVCALLVCVRVVLDAPLGVFPWPRHSLSSIS